VTDYNQTDFSRNSSDEYFIVTPEKFADKIESLPGKFKR